MNAALRSRWVFLAVVALGTAALITQLVLLRELLSALAGNELVLAVALGNWLLLTGLGAMVGRSVRSVQRPVPIVVLVLAVVSVLPLLQLVAVRVLRDVVFVRGALVGLGATLTGSFVLLAPFCLLSGFLLTLASHALGGPDAIGRVYVADTLGSIFGGVLFSFGLVYWCDHFTALCVPAVLGLVIAAGLAWVAGMRAGALACLVAVAAVLAFAWGGSVDAWTTARQFPGQRVLFRGHSPYGRLVVTEAAGQLSFVQNGALLFATPQVQQVEEAVHYALAQRPAARRVLVLGGGASGAAREILKYPAAEVTYVELDSLLVDVASRFLPEALVGSRLSVVAADGRPFVRNSAPSFYDVVLVNLPDPSTMQLNRYYTREFFADVQRALTPDGVLGFAVGQYENFVSEELARVLATARATAAGVFKQVLLLPAGRVFFLASNGPLTTNIAERLAVAGVETQWINRHYLAATLTAERLGAVERAATEPARVNTDLNPVLYFHHLRYWLSQFQPRLVLPAVVVAGVFLLYVLRLRPGPLAVLAGGFAATALEVVLLLGFQILYGSVYYQVGIIVTVFMVGLAVGAAWANRYRQPQLLWVVIALGVFAALLPAVLVWLVGNGGLAGRVLIPALTFVLAVLVGMEFPLASRLESAAVAVTAGRLYLADLVGAAGGALLVGTLLVPTLGVAGVCWLTAGLNAVAAVVVWWRR